MTDRQIRSERARNAVERFANIETDIKNLKERVDKLENRMDRLFYTILGIGGLVVAALIAQVFALIYG